MKTVVFDQFGLEMRAVALSRLISEEPCVFETMRTYNGTLFALEEHLSRLKDSARTVGLRFTWSAGQLQRILKRSVKQYTANPEYGGQDIFTRLILWPGHLAVMAGLRQHAPDIFKKGVSLITTPVQRPFVNAGAPQAKTNAYQTGLLAFLEPHVNAGEKLFLDARGYVAEVSIGNIFMVKKGVLFTPAEQGILNGVTRRFVIECALQLGIETDETYLTRHDFFNADEVFLTNTSWEMLPVCEIDKRKIGIRIPGSMTRSIHKHFKRKVSEQCQK